MATSIYDIFNNQDKRDNAKKTVKELGRTGLGIALPLAALSYGLKLDRGDFNKYLFDARNKRGDLTRQAGQKIRNAVLKTYQPNADAMLDRAAKIGQSRLDILNQNDPLSKMLGVQVNSAETISKAKEETMAILQTIRTRTQDLISPGQQSGSQVNELINQLDSAIMNIDTLFEHVNNVNQVSNQQTRDLYDQTNNKIIDFARQYGSNDKNRNAAFGSTFKQYDRIANTFYSDSKNKELQGTRFKLNSTKIGLGLEQATTHNIYGSGSASQFIQNKNIFSQDFNNIDDVINALNVKHAGLSAQGKLSTISQNIRNRYNSLSKIMHNSGRFQIVQEFDAVDKVVSSVYYLPKFGNKEVPIALHLSRDAATNVAYYRSTGQMGARYAMPETFYDASELQNIMKMTSKKEQIEALQKARARGSFEDFQISFFKSIHGAKQVQGSQLNMNSLTGEEVNQILDMFRSTGVTSERRTSDIISKGATHFNESLMRNLRNAEAIQSNKPIIYNTNKLGNRTERTTFLSRLVSSNLGFEGVIGASTQTTDIEMKALGGTFSYGTAGVRYHLNYDQATDSITKSLAFNPMNSIQSMGIMNRAIQPLVAREHQYHGKKELVMGFTNKTSSKEISQDIYDVSRKRFGRFNQVRTFGTGSELIGISGNKVGKEMVGVNVQGLLIVDDDLALNIGGFGEGAGYYGGRPIVRQSKDKTIIQTDYAPTTALSQYIAAKQQEAGGDVYLGSRREIQEFFEKFGSTLGEGDAGSVVDIKRLTSMHQMTIKMGEATPDLSRHKISFVIETANVEGGPKLFGPMIKHTGSSMPMLTRDIAEEVIGRVMMSGTDFSEVESKDLYLNEKDYEQDLNSKSNSMFGKDYASLTPEEQKQVELKAKVQKITKTEIEKNFGVKYESLILTDYGQAKKSVYHATTSASGGLMSLGYSREELQKAGMFDDVRDPISGRTISELTDMDTFDVESLNKYAQYKFKKKYDKLSEAQRVEIDEMFKQLQLKDFSEKKATEHFIEKSFQTVKNNLNKKIYKFKSTEVVAENLDEAKKLIFKQISTTSNNFFKDTIDKTTGAIAQSAKDKRTTLLKSINAVDAIKEIGEFKPSAFSMGLVFGGLRYMTEKKGKFGFKKGSNEFESLLMKYSKDIYNPEEQETLLRAAKLGITMNASYAQIGPVASVLGNNLAAIEPRISNFYLNRLVHDFGMNADEAIGNLGSLLVRQKGFGERLALMEQMSLMTKSMSPLQDNIKYHAEVEELLSEPLSKKGTAQLQKLTKEETNELLRIASGQENTQLKDFLSSFNVRKGVVVDVENLSDDKHVREQLERIIGGKKNIILPAGKPIEFLSSTSIKKSLGSSGGDEIIENDVLRLINDTFLHIGTASHRKDPGYLLGRDNDAGQGRIQVYMQKLQEKFGILYRNLNTLDLQGSSTIEGGGITLSADSADYKYYQKSPTGEVSSYSFVHKNPEMNRIQINRMQKAFDQAKGYAGFMDTQAYVNTLTDFMGGVKSDTQWRVNNGYLDPAESAYFDSLKKKGMGKGEIIDKMSRKFYRQSITSFLLGMEEGVSYNPKTNQLYNSFNPEGISGMAIRNPALSPGNINLGMSMYRMVDDSVTDTMHGTYSLKNVLKQSGQGTAMLHDLKKHVTSNEFINKVSAIQGGSDVLEKLGLDLADTSKFDFTNFNQLKILSDLSKIDQLKIKDIEMTTVDENTGRVVMKESTDSSGKKIMVSDKRKRSLKGAVGDILEQYINTLRDTAGVGGGKMYYVNQNVDVEFEYKQGDEIKKHTYKNKRVDFSRYGIGDYDGDAYAWVNSTNNQLRRKLYGDQEGDEIIKRMHRYGTEFLMYFDLLGEGMDSLNKKFGNFDKTIKFLERDDQSKEQLIKSVGGLDVSVKKVILGNLNQVREYQHKGMGSNQFDDLIKKNMSAIALLSTSVEILNIKAKKLEKSTNITDELKSALNTDMERGGVEHTEKFFKNLFKGTKFENGIKITNFHMLNVPHDSAGAKLHKEAAEGLTFSLDDAIEGIREGISAAREGKLEYLSSDKRTANLFSSIDELTDTDTFMKALNPLSTESLEGALINGTRRGDSDFIGSMIDDFSDQLDRQYYAMGNLSMKGNRNTMYALGAGVLGAGYLLGPSIDDSPLEGPGQFSDYKINKRIAEGTLYEKMKQDKDISVPQIPTPSRDLFVNRQVNYNETYMAQNNNYLMFGELNNIKSLPTAASMISRNGGTASIRISDNRMPITGSYVDRLLGER